MRQLSSSLTPAFKMGPITLIGVGLVILVTRSITEGGLSLRIVLEACGITVFTWVVTWLTASDLADEVYDGGDHLVIKRGRTTDKIPLSNLRMVEGTRNSSPEIMTLHFVRSTAFGRKIGFSPAGGRLNPLREHPLVEDLMNRAHAARL